MRAISLSALMATCISIASPAMAASLLNGDFESPVVTVGSFQNFTAGNDIGGWTAVGPAVSLVNGTFNQSGFSFPAQSGAQWLDLTGFTSNTSEGVEQTVDTVAGTNYSVKFWVGNVSGSVFGTTSTVNLLIDDVLLLAATNSGGTTTLEWQEFTALFTAASASTKVTFLNGDPGTDNSNGLDNVSIAEAAGGPVVIPLPLAAWQGLGLLGALAGARLTTRVRASRAARAA